MQKKIFLILFLISAFSLSAFAQNKDPQEELSSEKISPPKLVTAIEIEGNKAISTNTVISKMKTRIGSPYQENVANDDLKRLYLLGFFSDIKMDTKDYKGGYKIVITVVERPIIDKITFTGIRRITLKDEKIKTMLKSKEAQYLDYPSLAEDVRTLEKLYEKMGFSQSKITYKVIPTDQEKNKVSVEFSVSEGRKVTIKGIYILGNSSFPAKRILGLLKTKRGWLLNAGILKDEVFKEDIERIKSFYQREGFADVAVEHEVKPDPNKAFFLYITIKIAEGKQYRVGNITIQGNKDVPEKMILSKIKDCTPGNVFSQDTMRQDAANIQSLYFDKGYITCEVQENTSLNPASGRVDIVYNIRENGIAYVDKIRVRGNIKTKDIVVRREMRIKPGDKFDGEKLRRSKERLQNLGFFEEISYDTQDTSEPDKKDLVVEVKESKTGAFSFGGGYSTVDEFVGFVEIEQKNFDWKNWPYFTGDGQDLRFRASIGSVTNEFDLSFTEPWMFDYPVAFGFDAYRRTHKRDTDVGYGYDEKITGGDLRLNKELSEYVRGSLTYRLDSINIENISDGASTDLNDERGTNKISSGEFGLSYDTRDNVFDATRGDLIGGTFQAAGGPFAGDKDYLKFFLRASHYFPMPRGSVLEIRGRIGLAGTYGNSEKLPIYERFFAGGADTIRGYHERTAGPVDPVSKDPLGGNSMLIGNIEYTYPLFSFLKVAGFFDIGNVWRRVGDICSSTDSFGVENSGGFKSSVGLGLRIKSPIGPIVLDYGIPFNKEPGEESKGGGRFHFSASHGF
ncbi:MAG: outer membrane protein assembly factor BamA [Candidatus Omnitrophica bacterium]|nr:outer membrane protein assembly factor BamA [Candidatus Omnitrophota bacterium]